MAITEKTVFETGDGRQFLTLEDARRYEQFHAIKADLCNIITNDGARFTTVSYSEAEKIAYRLMREHARLGELLNQAVVYDFASKGNADGLF